MSLKAALAGIAALIASFLTMYAIGGRVGAGPSTAILSAVLALTLWRREGASRRSPWLTLVMLPLLAVSAAFAGEVLVTIPALGAVLFVAAIFVSVWLRQYGERTAEIGSLIALPFVVMLIVPVRPNAPGGPLVNLALVVCAGLLAYGWVAVVRFAAVRIGLTQRGGATRMPRSEPRAAAAGALSVSTRMALQMAVALAAAFAIGFWVFPQHWGWVVLTAFIVCSGARGRGDAAYKGLLRLGGALAGTLGAAVVQHVALPNGIATACAIFAALFLGMWLRERNYAYWAVCITLVLALLQRTESAPGIALLVGRLEGICIGALCAVGATWFVYPIKTEAVIRRRVADVLAALDELFPDGPETADERAQKLALLEHRVAEMDRVAPPVELHRRVFARGGAEHPAAWIAIVRELIAHARDRVEGGKGDGDASARRAIRFSRRSIGRRLTPQELEAAGDAPVTTSLQRLRDTLKTTP